MQEPQAAGDKPLADQIIDRIQADPKKPISPAETAVLQIQYRQLNNLFEDACNKQETARQAGDAAAQEQAAYDVNRHHARLDEVEQAYELAGQAWGRAGAARRMELAKDMTPAGITRRWIAAQHGEALSKAQREEINKLAGAFQREEQAWAATSNRRSRGRFDARIEDAIQDDRARRKPPKAARPAPVEKPLAPEIQSMLGRLADWLKPKADEALARIRARRQRPCALDVTGVPGMIAEDLKDAAILGSYHIANGLLEIGKWKRAMLEAVGEWITPHLDAVWQESVASIGRPDKPAEIGFDEGAVQKILDRPAVEKKPKTPLGRQPAKMPAYIPERENAEELLPVPPRHPAGRRRCGRGPRPARRRGARGGRGCRLGRGPQALFRPDVGRGPPHPLRLRPLAARPPRQHHEEDHRHRPPAPDPAGERGHPARREAAQHRRPAAARQRRAAATPGTAGGAAEAAGAG